jgi:predicted AlkP superfamily phosphohydrolase/phosphomutase
VPESVFPVMTLPFRQTALRRERSLTALRREWLTALRPERTGPAAVRKLRTFVVSMLCLGLAAACDDAARSPAAKDDSPAVTSPPPRVVVLGLDAGTWELLDPWMKQGLLPNLARLKAEGAYGKLRSTEVSSSPVIWTSIATGKVPEKTGITWFVRFPGGVGKPVPVDRRQLKTNTLWDMLSRRRIDVAVLGWYVTWPAKEVNGRLLSDVAHFGRTEGSAWPSQFLWDLKPIPSNATIAAMPRFMDYQYDAAKAVKKEGEAPTLDYLVYDRFLRAWSRDRFYLDAAHRTLSDGPLPEAFFLYLRGTDDVQHGFWKFMQPEAFAPRNGPDGKPVKGTGVVPPEQVAAFGKVIERYWQWTDEEVGKILAHYSKSPPLVIVCSDHGAGPAVGAEAVDVPEYLHLSGAHRIDGIVMAHGPGIRKGAEITGATIYDIAPTLLYALGLPIGKDMDGKVLTDIFESPRGRVETVDTWDTVPVVPVELEAGQELPPAMEKETLEHLKSLGYIGQ